MWYFTSVQLISDGLRKEKVMFEELKDIYNVFEDEESKMIFRFRLLYGLTDNMEYIKEMLLSFRKENKGFYDILDVLEDPDFFRNRETTTNIF